MQPGRTALGPALAGRAREDGEVQLPGQADRIFVEAAQLAERTAERLEAVVTQAERLGEGREREDEEEADGVERAIADLLDSAKALRNAFFGGDEDAVAAFERLEAPFDRWRLAVRAVAPGEMFHERFDDKLEALACVSARLFVRGDAMAAPGGRELD